MSWPLVKIGDIVTKIETWNPGKHKGNIVFSYIDLSSVDKDTKKIISESITQVVSDKAPSRARQLVEGGDVLVATVRPNLNGVAMVEAEFSGATASTGYCVLRSNHNLVYNRYLFYWVQTSFFVNEMISKASGANYPAVSDKIIKESEIPLPPLAEQKRIAAILDKADAIRRKRQQSIELADEFLHAVFLDMFGDPVTNPKGLKVSVLKNIAHIRSGVTKGKKIDLSTAITLPYMRVANVQDGYLALDDVQEIAVSPADAQKCKLVSGDILLTEGGDPDKLGRGHVWRDEIPNCIHQNHIFSVRIKDLNKVRPEFLSALIASQRGKQYFLKVGKQTTGIATINKTVLSEFEPFIPPIELQDRYLNIVNAQNSYKRKTMGEENVLFAALSQKAFSGEL
ncbi:MULTISPECIES: restriction endonuclease subunit S [unclassified Vibrio]|uniref:restriction endonuclease subunit S n=1 Tax=unclassified Vibrio TaxID=2614977 RepID=UPI001483442C|nr:MULTISPECIES: restriction endonuclease subunit S [unclassified Vibrio]NNN44921.1 restriction endonuclease subunit S [Vibrio sp. 1-1(7)]NNN72294.1 restriction endonuclease subunit S [Vibrio sp. 12-2(3-a)]